MHTIMFTSVSTVPDAMQQEYFNSTNEHQHLTTHMYRNNVRQLRYVEDAYFDCMQQLLRSTADYKLAAGAYLHTPLLTYLREYRVVTPGDWPSQSYQRQMSYVADSCPPSLHNTLASMGPLHVSLNTQENVVLKFMPFDNILSTSF